MRCPNVINPVLRPMAEDGGGNVVLLSSVAGFSGEATAYHLPGLPISVEDWCARCGHPPAKAEAIRKHGGEMVHITDEPVEKIVFRAVAQLVDRGALDPAGIGLVLYAHTTQVSVPKPPRNMSALVMHRVGIKRAFGFSISEQNCVSVYMAVRIARAMLLRRPELGAALIVAGGVIPNEGHRESDEVGLNSDGASEMILKIYPCRNRIIDMVIHSESAFSDRIFSDADPKRKLKGTQAYYLCAERIIGTLLRMHGVGLNDVSIVLPHNLDFALWHSLIRFLRGRTDQHYTANFARKGHALCNDFVINLTDIDTDLSDRLNPGDPVLLWSAGHGGSVAAAIVSVGRSQIPTTVGDFAG